MLERQNVNNDRSKDSPEDNSMTPARCQWSVCSCFGNHFYRVIASQRCLFKCTHRLTMLHIKKCVTRHVFTVCYPHVSVSAFWILPEVLLRFGEGLFLDKEIHLDVINTGNMMVCTTQLQLKCKWCVTKPTYGENLVQQHAIAPTAKTDNINNTLLVSKNCTERGVVNANL